jgi:DNA-directed RNA polymerase specialized sigma24 family protein
MPTRRDSRWQLSDGALQQLLMRLDVDPERAGERYEALRRTLLKYFEWRGALEPDTCADETLDRVARKIEQGAEVADLRAFAYGVARLIVLERARSKDMHHVTLEETSKTLAAPEPVMETPLAACLDQCLQALPDASRAIILGYYADERRTKIDRRRQLARELGVTPEALRNRAQRLRDRLADCILRCERSGARPRSDQEST